MRLKIVVSLSRKIARQLQRRYSKMRLLLWLQEVVICLVFQTFFYIKSPQTTKKVSLLKKGVCIRITLVAYLLTYQIFKVLSIGKLLITYLSPFFLLSIPLTSLITAVKPLMASVE